MSADKPGPKPCLGEALMRYISLRLDTLTALGGVCKAKSLRNHWKRNSIEGNCVELGFPVSA